MKGDLTWGCECTVQYTDEVSRNCVTETYVILLANVIPINLIKRIK